MVQHRVSMNCTAVSLPHCPVENTIYGYYPNLGVNAFFIAFFALCAFIQVFQGWKGKTYFYGYVLVLGCLGEITGYIGRVIMHGNPVRVKDGQKKREDRDGEDC